MRAPPAQAQDLDVTVAQLKGEGKLSNTEQGGEPKLLDEYHAPDIN
jgi:hypothetical protein